MKHSILYKEWMVGACFSKIHIKLFLKKNMKIEIFTLDDIKCLCDDIRYCYLFMTKILVNHIDYLYQIMSIDMFVDFMNRYSELRNAMFLFLVERYDEHKDVFEKLRTFSQFNMVFLHSFEDFIVYQKQHNKKDFSSFLPTCSLSLFLNNYQTEPYYKEVVDDIMENPAEIKRCILSSNGRINQLFQILKILSPSKHFQLVYEQFKHKIYEWFLEVTCSIDDSLFYSVILLIDDFLLRKANMNLWDLSYFNSGSFSDVYKAGDYVIKIGEERICNTVCASESFLYPLVRKYIEDLGLFLEIAYLVDSSSITAEDVYQVYAYERDHKRVWGDAKVNNLGRLLCDNNSYDVFVDSSTLGFLGEMGSVKSSGELVILDTDLVFLEDNFPFEVLKNNDISLYNYKKMENRYQNEIKLGLRKKR